MTSIELKPASVPVVDRETRPVVTVKWIDRPFAGAAAPRRIMVPARSRFLPIVLPLSMRILGWPTVALMVAN